MYACKYVFCECTYIGTRKTFSDDILSTVYTVYIVNISD